MTVNDLFVPLFSDSLVILYTHADGNVYEEETGV